MQQATINILADMGAQPTTLMSGMVPATASTDTTPPTSTITSPAPGTNVSDGASVTVTGTATDAGGGVVAGVEISTDGGTTWHPVTTMSAANTSVTWSYTWIAHGDPSTTIETRATDDSGNIETPSDAETVNVGCPCSIWGSNVIPPTPDSGDGNSIEVGIKFTSDIAGTINGIRFYKASTNTGTHIGNLWTASGQLLASATFTNETASGWQQVNFAQPVNISPNTTYIASYFAPSGHYSESEQYFDPPLRGGATLNSPPLHAVRNTQSNPNGLYIYTKTSAFPTQTFNAENYWVDVSFTPATPPGQPTNVTATAGTGSATVTWTAASSGGQATSYTVTPYIGTTAQTPVTVTGNPGADHGDRHRPDQRHELHLHRDPVQLVGHWPSFRRVERGDADGADGARGADRCHGDRRQQLRERVVDRAGQQWRERDHQLHDHALPVGRGAGTDHGDRDAAGHDRHSHRPDQRADLHVHGDRGQRGRLWSGVVGLQRRHAVHHPGTGLRPAGEHPRPLGKQPVGHSVQAAWHREPPGGGGRSLEQRQGDDQQRHRYGRRYVHRGESLHRPGSDRAERLDGAHHRGSGHDPDRDREALIRR